MNYDIVFIDWNGHCHVYECESLFGCYCVMSDVEMEDETQVRDYIIVAHA